MLPTQRASPQFRRARCRISSGVFAWCARTKRRHWPWWTAAISACVHVSPVAGTEPAKLGVPVAWLTLSRLLGPNHGDQSGMPTLQNKDCHGVSIGRRHC